MNCPFCVDDQDSKTVSLFTFLLKESIVHYIYMARLTILKTLKFNIVVACWTQDKRQKLIWLYVKFK